MTNYKFTQPVSMQVNQEQFDYLKPKLEGLGYEPYKVTNVEEHYEYIVTNATWNPNYYSNNCLQVHDNCNRHFIDHYNPELFLAIAAMTDAPNGIKEEIFKCILDSGNYEKGKYYKVGGRGKLINPYYLQKATITELISHYTKPKTDMSTETRNVAFTLEQAKELYTKDKEQYAWLLPTFPELEWPVELTIKFRTQTCAESFKAEQLGLVSKYKGLFIEPKKD